MIALQAHLILLHLLRFVDVEFLEIEGKTHHQQKNYNLLSYGGLEPHLQYLRGRPVNHMSL